MMRVRATVLTLTLLFVAAPSSAWTAPLGPQQRRLTTPAPHHYYYPRQSTAGSKSSWTLTGSITSIIEESNTGSVNKVVNSDQIETLITWIVPPVCTAASFASYQTCRQLFHNFIDYASGNTWTVADGGKFMAEMVRPILNGPVTLSISILFGTLVATTISSLYNRQTQLAQSVVATQEQVSHLALLVEGLPDPGYRTRTQQLLSDYVEAIYQDFDQRNVTGDTLSRPQLFAMILLLNDYVNDKAAESNGLVWQIYSGVDNLQGRAADFRSALHATFAPGHYANMVALAITILFVFLLETDQDAVQFLLGFQLSICWALLVGTYSLLAVVIYDLTTPFVGVFRVMVGDQTSTHRRELAHALLAQPLIDREKDGT